ncbi:hypothetical protein [Pseudomonas sp. NFX183]|uniref:hypothetical protein n=1 Tax=Pseudomonas sp. NFX183 TaxID=3399573 RepID=UPI003A5C1F06
MSIYGVEEFLMRARKFITAGDENSLRHACLELRFCLERIVYKKLSHIGEQLPLSVYQTWQPPKAMKLLLSFEPRADQDASLDICLNTVDGQPSGEWLSLGDYKMFTAKWLNKHYNKLGKFLHMTSLSEAGAPPEITAPMIESIADEIERVATASAVITMNSVTTLKCDLCNSDMYASQAQIADEGEIECYQDQCRARYFIQKVDEDRFRLDRAGLFSIPCKGCGQRLALETVSHDEVKVCVGCGHRHLFRWSYASLPETTVAS